MRFLRQLLDKLTKLGQTDKRFKRWQPLIEALDEFLFGTDKVTRHGPHILDGLDIKRYICFVVLALLPAALAGVYFFGPRVLLVIFVSYFFGGLTEAAFSILRRKPLYEGFLATGLIFPLILPPGVPLWVVAIGIVFGVFFGKEVFGGTGRNIFNPALVGRVFVSLAFPQYFATQWQQPLVDAVTSATPLINFKSGLLFNNYWALLWGGTAGSIGETFRIGLIFGGLLLILTKIADWRIPLSYLLSVFVAALFGHALMADKIAEPMFQLLSGGLMFGAFFMATDPVTAPLTSAGRWTYGILLGLLTVLIRGLSGFAEGVMFAILLMNAAAPLIDAIVINLKFRRMSLT